MDFQNCDYSFDNPIPGQTFSSYPNIRLKPSTRSYIILTIEDPKAPVLNTRQAIVEFRSLSGLSWNQIAMLFGTSRRSLHYWASGKAMNEENEKHLFSLHKLIKEIDRGSGKANRSLLRSDKIFEMLVDKKYNRVLLELGKGQGRTERSSSRLSAEEKEMRKPTPIETLVGSYSDRSGIISEEKGRGVKIGGKRKHGAAQQK